MSGIPKRLQGVPIFSCGRAIRGVGFTDSGGFLSAFAVPGDRKKPAGYIPAGFRYRYLLRTVLAGGLFAGGSLSFSLSSHPLSASSSLLLHSFLTPSSPPFRLFVRSFSDSSPLSSSLSPSPPSRPDSPFATRGAFRLLSIISPSLSGTFPPRGSEERCRITRRSAAAQAERPAEPQPRRPAVPYAEKPFRPAPRRRCPQPF